MCECVLSDLPENAGAILAGDHESGALDRPGIWGFRTVLLVESRDDVFERLASDLAAARVRVVRARCSNEAIRRYLRAPAHLLVVNGDQPGESAWLLAAKLHLTHPAARIWAYKCQSLPLDMMAVRFLDVDELIEYGGDLSRLTDEILHRLWAATGLSVPPGERAGRTAPMEAVA